MIDLLNALLILFISSFNKIKVDSFLVDPVPLFFFLFGGGEGRGGEGQHLAMRVIESQWRRKGLEFVPG